jgi:hypothetical protein
MVVVLDDDILVHEIWREGVEGKLKVGYAI